jgi:hypothetical protein
LSPNQQKIISALLEKSSYPHKVSNIKLEETHISWVFLTGLYAYKIKKGLKFGKVLDFSTLAKRRKTCERELKLNKNLCGDMYVEVVKILREENSNIVKMVNLQEYGKAVEYALKMKQMPQEFRMDNLIAACSMLDFLSDYGYVDNVATGHLSIRFFALITFTSTGLESSPGESVFSEGICVRLLLAVMVLLSSSDELPTVFPSIGFILGILSNFDFFATAILLFNDPSIYRRLLL